MKTVGSKAEVWHNHAKHTSGGLKKNDLMFRKGRIISRKKHAAGKKAIKRLVALGYKAKKGSFTLFRKSMVNGRKKSRKATRKRGGWAEDKVATPAVATTPASPAAPNAPAVANAPASGLQGALTNAMSKLGVK